MELLADLTEPQKRAVTHVDGPLLVLAGAGSGKTRVVTRRIAFLTAQGVEPWRILAITFTNKAAGEMRERVKQLGGAQGAWVSTFHSFAARQLRRFADRIGLSRSFTILDRTDQLALVKEAIVDVGLEPKQWKPRTLLEEIDRAKGQLLDPEAYSSQAHGYAEDRIGSIYAAYEELLRQRESVDFTDLLVRLVRLLRADDEVRERLQRRFRYLLVDEYQDTNAVQYELARILAAASKNFHATGDPDQSIYRWRGADLRNILDFENDFPGAKIVKLEQNFRSTAMILAAAQGVIEHNRERREKTLWTENPQGKPLKLLRPRDESEEAWEVARRCADLRDTGASLSEIAVFVRIAALSLPLERAFFERGVPYRVVGAVAFYQRKEIKDLLAYLRLLANPKDDLALLRVINVPPRRIGRATVTKLQSRAKREKRSLCELVTEAEDLDVGRTTRAVRRFGLLIGRLAAQPRTLLLPLLRNLIEEIGYVEHLESAGDQEAEARLENVGALLDAVAEFDTRGAEGEVEERDALERFLEEIALLSEVDEKNSDEARVSVMTLHASKGLEFDHVFMIAFEDRILPHSRAAESAEELEEERRLCYVGFTRARQSLTLSHVRYRSRWGRTEMGIPSPFLNEIPSECFSLRRPRAVPIEPERALPDPVEAPVGLTEGERVMHHVFGAGTVLSVEGFGPRSKVRVAFDTVGEKKLFQQWARLVPCES